MRNFFLKLAKTNFYKKTLKFAKFNNLIEELQK